MPRPRRSSRRASGPRPRYRWVSDQIAELTTVSAGQQSAFDLLSPVPAASRWGITVVRMLGELYVGPASTGADVEWQHGVTLMDLDAFSASALPEMSQDMRSYYYHNGGYYFRDADAGPSAARETWDIRTARRMRSERDTLVHIMENTDASASLVYQLFYRLLVKLP